jgi:hypothetical protein
MQGSQTPLHLSSMNGLEQELEYLGNKNIFKNINKLWKTGNQRVVVRIFILSSHYESKTTTETKTGLLNFSVFFAQGVWRIYCPQISRLITNPLREKI